MPSMEQDDGVLDIDIVMKAFGWTLEGILACSSREQQEYQTLRMICKLHNRLTSHSAPKRQRFIANVIQGCDDSPPVSAP